MKTLLLTLFFVPVALCGFQAKSQSQTYYQEAMPVKVHLTLNQDVYSSGDTIFFKATIAPSGAFAPARTRTILHLLIKRSDNATLQHDAIRIENKDAAGQLIISPFLPAGEYQLVAYNDWMEKFDPSLFFEKTIFIGAPRKKENKGFEKISLSPEGGNLIAGLRQKIAISGPENHSGSIKNKSNEIVAEFNLDHNGLGSAFITAALGQYYTAHLTNNVESVPLGNVQEDGLVITLTGPESGSTVRARIEVSDQSPLLKKKIRFIATRDGTSFDAGTLQWNEQSSTDLDLSLAHASAGIAVLTLLEDNTVIAERLFFIPEKSPSRPTIQLPAKEFSTRQKVTMTVTLPDGSKSSTNTTAAVTVFQKNNTVRDDKTIVNNWLFYRDIKNANKLNLFQDSADQFSSLDNFLITQQWRRALRSAPDKNHPQEYLTSRIHLSGNVLSTSGQPVPDSAKITLLLQKSVSIYYAYTKNGTFNAEVWMDFFGQEDIFYRVTYKGKTLDYVRLIPDKYPLQILDTEDVPEEVLTFEGKRKSIDRSFQYYSKTFVAPAPDLNKAFEEEIFAPDVQVKLSDYLIFPTMAETLREVVSYVQHRNDRGKDIVRVLTKIGDIKRLAQTDPLFVIDGIVTDDVSVFMSLKPSDVVAIKVINRIEKLNMFGDLGKGGIILVETKLPDFRQTVRIPETTMTVAGLLEPLPFTQVRHENTNPRIPDLRTNLCWLPNVSFDEKGEAAVTFYTNDVTGTFVIRIEGVTSSGKPFYTEDNFSVRFKK